MSRFGFLERESPIVFDAEQKAKAAVHADPGTALFHVRRTLGLTPGRFICAS